MMNMLHKKKNRKKLIVWILLFVAAWFMFKDDGSSISFPDISNNKIKEEMIIEASRIVLTGLKFNAKFNILKTVEEEMDCL